jgi:hypothetical protein
MEKTLAGGLFGGTSGDALTFLSLFPLALPHRSSLTLLPHLDSSLPARQTPFSISICNHGDGSPHTLSHAAASEQPSHTSTFRGIVIGGDVVPRLSFSSQAAALGCVSLGRFAVGLAGYCSSSSLEVCGFPSFQCVSFFPFDFTQIDCFL